MSDDDHPELAQSARKLTALSLSDVATLLKRSGSHRASEAVVREDIDAGAPTNADGTINLIHYAAWLAKEVGHAD